MTAGAIGMYQSGQAQKQAAQLTGQITSAAQPFSQFGSGITTQLAGGAPMAGPMGPAITAQTGAAQTLSQTAQQYASGNLTPAQQQQIQAYIQQQKSMAMSELASAGITDPNSAQMQSRMQEINNNAMMQAQQMVQGNVNISNTALTTAQSVFQNLISAAVSSGALGLQGISVAVQTQIQQNTAIKDSLNKLFGQVVNAMATAAKPAGGGGGAPAGGGGQTAWGAVQNIASKFGIGGGADQGLASQYSPSNIQSAMPTPDLSTPAIDLSGPSTDPSVAGLGSYEEGGGL